MSSNIGEIKSILEKLNDIRGNQKSKIVFVSGNFNIIHPGHLRLFRFAKECGDLLVVGLHQNENKGVCIEQKLRREALGSIGLVDYILPLEISSTEIIEKLKPDIVLKGKEHESRFNSEAEAVQKYGGTLLFGSGEISFSASSLIRQEIVNPSSIGYLPKDFMSRHDITITNLIKHVEAFSNLKVCVVGDTIVDDYINCSPQGMSQEDPTIVVTPESKKTFVGGAGIVSMHAKNLGADVSFFTVLADDDAGSLAREKLNSSGVTLHAFMDSSRPTSLKQRYRASGKTLLRVNHIRKHSISKQISQQILEEFEKNCSQYNLLIFSDFNYGILPQNLVDSLTKIADKNQIMTIADSQSSSQIGDISRFEGVELVTPTEREARIGVRDFEVGLAALSQSLMEKSKCKNLIITLGSDGVFIQSNQPEGKNIVTDQLHALNKTPVDISGAGDSLLIVTSMALCSGSSLFEGALLGSIAAAYQVSREGNIPLNKNEILEFFENV